MEMAADYIITTIQFMSNQKVLFHASSSFTRERLHMKHGKIRCYPSYPDP